MDFSVDCTQIYLQIYMFIETHTQISIEYSNRKRRQKRRKLKLLAQGCSAKGRWAGIPWTLKPVL